MTANTDAEIRHIYDTWHEAVLHRDLERLMALYAEDAVFETPLVIASGFRADTGILSGRAEIRPFFEAGFRKFGGNLGRWYRTGTFFSNGRQLVWEYPRETPEGDQTDLIEMMDIAYGRILHHRVYWGWVGFKALTAPSHAG